jgi:threonine synthase
MIMNGYCCIACGRTQSADFSGYQCPACSSNLEITYDYAASAGDVEQGFDGDDIFRYAALLPVARPTAWRVARTSKPVPQGRHR